MKTLSESLVGGFRLCWVVGVICGGGTPKSILRVGICQLSDVGLVCLGLEHRSVVSVVLGLLDILLFVSFNETWVVHCRLGWLLSSSLDSKSLSLHILLKPYATRELLGKSACLPIDDSMNIRKRSCLSINRLIHHRLWSEPLILTYRFSSNQCSDILPDLLQVQVDLIVLLHHLGILQLRMRCDLIPSSRLPRCLYQLRVNLKPLLLRLLESAQQLQLFSLQLVDQLLVLLSSKSLPLDLNLILTLPTLTPLHIHILLRIRLGQRALSVQRVSLFLNIKPLTIISVTFSPSSSQYSSSGHKYLHFSFNRKIYSFFYLFDSYISNLRLEIFAVCCTLISLNLCLSESSLSFMALVNSFFKLTC